MAGATFHVAVTRHPTADWAAQQIVECCAWDRAPPRFLIHDRDSRYGANFDRRVRGLGIRQVRTPFRSPRANAVAERWVRSVRSECLDPLIVFNEVNLRGVLSAYVTYYNRWRPHRSLGQAVPCGEARRLPRQACRFGNIAGVLTCAHVCLTRCSKKKRSGSSAFRSAHHKSNDCA
jgi:transposase InsO family protein